MKLQYIPILIMLLSSCTDARLYEPCDTLATDETRSLYYSMQRMTGTGTIFGHQDDTGYGVGWKFDDGASDVKEVTGVYPGLYGWDLAKIEHGSLTEINNIPFRLQQLRIQEAYRRGGINSFCWHMDNPVTDSTAWDTAKLTVKQILPGGAFHTVFKHQLDRAASYLLGLKGPDGEAIPLLFRPFHELTGTWFWWGENNCTPNEFKTLWRFTVDYLRNKQGLHNLLMVYSVADFKSEAEFLERYPGDGYADILGFDCYCTDAATFATIFNKRLIILDKITAKHKKLGCVAETGYMNIPAANWWTKTLLPVIAKHKLAYLMVWRNADSHQFFAPYKGQESAEDFKKFAKSDSAIFQDRLSPLNIYGRINE